MTSNERLLTVAIAAMKKERQRYAFDANLAKDFQDPPIFARQALEKYNELSDAIDLLEEIKQGILKI